MFLVKVQVKVIVFNHSMKAFITSAVGGGEWTALCMILFTPEERIPGRMQLKCNGTQ